MPELTGGGRVEITSLSDREALVSYFVVDRPLIESGGGSLRGGGTILIHPDGTITHIPPGDPFEKDARHMVRRHLEALVAEIGELRHR